MNIMGYHYIHSIGVQLNQIGRISKLKTKDLIAEAISLPVEERAMVVDSILRSLNPPDSDIDRKWATIAKRRIAELRSGEVEVVPDEEVFSRIWKRFSP
jgi:putative addiction module component (TIGR02574 family)